MGYAVPFCQKGRKTSTPMMHWAQSDFLRALIQKCRSPICSFQKKSPGAVRRLLLKVWVQNRNSTRFVYILLTLKQHKQYPLRILLTSYAVQYNQILDLVHFSSMSFKNWSTGKSFSQVFGSIISLSVFCLSNGKRKRWATACEREK